MNKELNIKFKFDNISDNCIYFIQNYIKSDDLLKAILSKNRVAWHTHTIIENSESIILFNELVDKISKDFNIIPTKTRINYFEKHTVKDYHKDFYKQDFTIVLNLHFGHILFKHDKTNNVLKFSIEPNTLYIFDKTVNDVWTHRVETTDIDRISIVIWGIKNS
jgi:hypothetical protein